MKLLMPWCTVQPHKLMQLNSKCQKIHTQTHNLNYHMHTVHRGIVSYSEHAS